MRRDRRGWRRDTVQLHTVPVYFFWVGSCIVELELGEESHSLGDYLYILVETTSTIQPTNQPTNQPLVVINVSLSQPSNMFSSMMTYI
jgi:hypothetical protein